MTDRPLVSVVVIFLDAERFLREAIDSILAQTYDRWELILVDDGSTDASTSMARSYVERMSEKVRYLEHDAHRNLGMSASRNLGISQCRGDYIAMLDSDDTWTPDKLEQQVDLLRTVPEAAVLYGQTMTWKSWTGYSSDATKDEIATLHVETDALYYPPTLLAGVIAERITSASMSSICFRREVFDRIGGFEDSFRGMYEDWVFLAKVYSQETVFIASQCWDRYRIHPDSCTAVASRVGLMESSRHAYLEWVEQYLEARGFRDNHVQRVLRKELWPYRHAIAGPSVRSAVLAFRILRRWLPSYLQKVRKL